jgi:hypothetical protein
MMHNIFEQNIYFMPHRKFAHFQYHTAILLKEKRKGIHRGFVCDVLLFPFLFIFENMFFCGILEKNVCCMVYSMLLKLVVEIQLIKKVVNGGSIFITIKPSFWLS